MGETKKVKKRRFNFLKFIVVILFLYIIVAAFLKLAKSPIKNIIILGNHYLKDEQIIEIASLENYPSFVKTTSSSICKKIRKLPLIKSCNAKKKFGYQLEIDVEEYKIVYKMRSNNKYILGNNESLESDKEYADVPVLINYVTDDISNRLSEKFSALSYDTLAKISEIEYSPTSYDKERFILYMIDGNMVYITLTKTSRLDKYDEIKKELEGHTGVLYLDSGNYFEIKE